MLSNADQAFFGAGGVAGEHAVLVREHPEMASRVVFVTGGAFTAEGSTFLDGIANERLEKPLDFKQLRATVQRFAR